ncbi:RNA polymerase factor sigma-54 [Vibrio breoganii]|uniref:RNA polymerase factor sigma-54 n=1 Tax=Vibrio breoganii TaxID=553239 RepID=UPI0002FE1D4B|nr:RNA polymerase factor sigma-54 [Vibrio breoganii]OCH76488.1 RNA polymerase factor sigma-54 [Vibrio breoganii]OEF86080.1 RNA polymerase factor sigma-54 [Vibrio breoganii 1C10]PMG31298.1 RNA polymerase factor sigma-54 [Vibrio breoganii]PML25908.1 RNA polymerase factor sigma-54 [Vibrio breoganii]PML85558.1 RNA polymerase factor sigma-54 [Vibrio breoganii]
MKAALQLKFGQQLAMTPQLQQAIRLLQLSSLELQQEIQEALDSNPLLQVVEDNNQTEEKTDSSQDTPAENVTEASAQDSAELMASNSIGEDLAMDTSWEDVYSSNSGNTGIAADDELPIYQGETQTSLYDHLLWQLELTPFTETDHAIAIAIIDAIDDRGFLTLTTADITASLSLPDVEEDETVAVLKRVQQFEPLGVGSRNLQECLLLQLNALPDDTPRKQQACEILENYIEYLANRDYKMIVKETKLKESDLIAVLQLIQQLDPRPGSQIGENDIEYVIPDVNVIKVNGKWTVFLNNTSTPKLEVNQHYATITGANSDDNQYIKDQLQEAKWLIKSLESRNDTLLKVARCIVETQQEFFDKGEEAMQPMILNDVAQAIDMHESTISRVTTQKYMHTPRGIFELKYFFSSHVSNDEGEDKSSTAIRALIKKLVAEENSAKPLSDNKIATLLAEQGVKVARRTVAKYRESLGIAPSSQRKRLV